MTHHTAFIKGLTFNSNSTLLCSQSDDLTTLLYSTPNFRLFKTFVGYSGLPSFFRRPGFSKTGLLASVNVCVGGVCVVRVVDLSGNLVNLLEVYQQLRVRYLFIKFEVKVKSRVKL